MQISAGRFFRARLFFKRNNRDNFTEDLHSEICACTHNLNVFNPFSKLKRISDRTSITNFRRVAYGTDVKKVARIYFVISTEVNEYV